MSEKEGRRKVLRKQNRTNEGKVTEEKKKELRKNDGFERNEVNEG